MKAENFFEKEFKTFGLKSQRKYPNEELCRFLGRNKKLFKKNTKCLEVGVGGGGNLMPLIDMNFRIDAIDISKTVKSAIANAENNFQYDIDNLFVKEAYVGKSLVMKRFRPRAKGRASPIKKPFSRITIVLAEKEKKNEKNEKKEIK